MGETAEVVAFPGATVSSDRKAFFLNELGAMFDRYVADYGCDPEAFVIVQGGIRQTCRVSWVTQGDSEGAAGAVLALALANLMREVTS